MELSGQLIKKGTGSYEVKEISFNPDYTRSEYFSVDTDGNGVADGWSLPFAADNTPSHSNGIQRLDVSGPGTNASVLYHALIKTSFFGSIVDPTKAYKVRIRYRSNSIIYLATRSGYGSSTFSYDETGDDRIPISLDFQTITLTARANNITSDDDLWIGIAGVADNWYEVDFVTFEEFEPLLTLDKGSKYLECTSAGTVAFPSKQAYGEWEFDISHKDTSTTEVHISDVRTDGTVVASYMLVLLNNERVSFRRNATYLMYSDVDYIEVDTWYRYKVTRTLDGEFTVYIKGGAYGVDEWTLVSTSSGLGTNPVTDTIYTESQYFVIDFDAGDRISNIIMRKGVEQ